MRGGCPPPPPPPRGGGGGGGGRGKRPDVRTASGQPIAAPSPNPLPHRERWERGLCLRVVGYFVTGVMVAHAADAAALSPARTLDNFNDVAPWTAQHTDDVSATLQS